MEIKNHTLFRGKRLLCVAGSPFQVMALIMMMSEERNKDFQICDVVLYDTIPDGEAIAERLRDTGLFSHVEYIPKRYPESRHRGLQHVVDSLLPHRSEVRLFSFCPYLKGREYDVLLTSWASGIALDAKILCVTSGITVLFDDGVGSHIGTVFEWFACFDDVAFIRRDRGKRALAKDFAKRIFRVFAGKKIMLDIKQVWLLSSTTLWAPRDDLQVFSIDMQAGFEDALEVLGANEEYASLSLPRILYFTLPDYVADELKEEELDLLRMLDEDVGDEFAIRVHPLRDKKDVEEFSSRIMDSKILWEAQIARVDRERPLVLIGAGSSAQVSPKMIFGQEPVVVFTYKLLSLDDNAVSGFDDMAASLAEAYVDRSKIHIPLSIKSLKDFVHAA